MLEKLPPEVRHWVENLSWKQRRYMLSLCHLLCGSSPKDQARFLDDFTADGIIAKILIDQDTTEQGSDKEVRIIGKTREKLYAPMSEMSV